MEYITRHLEGKLEQSLQNYPVVAILGPRQCGKSTLAGEVISKHPSWIKLDLEKQSDLVQLEEAELFFNLYRNKQICLDEIQRKPELFSSMRPFIDEENRNGLFLILGSASQDLIKQSSETLAGRILYLELSPLRLSEIYKADNNFTATNRTHWLRGGFPRAFLSGSDALAFEWIDSFIITFLERDLPQLDFNIPPKTLHRFWRMLSHVHGQVLNKSKLGESLGISHTTIGKYVEILVGTYMIRLLEPFEANVKKRVIKAPKLYFRDTGILHALQSIHTFENLHSHPIIGSSWEGYVIENIIGEMAGWEPMFYRTSNGSEIDLILKKGQRVLAFECKVSPAPKLTRGFWNAIEDVKPEKTFIVASAKQAYLIKKDVLVCNLKKLLDILPELSS